MKRMMLAAVMVSLTAMASAKPTGESKLMKLLERKLAASSLHLGNHHNAEARVSFLLLADGTVKVLEVTGAKEIPANVLKAEIESYRFKKVTEPGRYTVKLRMKRA
jgi:hypothetical protein